MKFRPCIDIHNGKVKQIVGSSLRDNGNHSVDNFVSDRNGDYYASLYKEDNLAGGHIILLNPVGSEYYEADCKQAYLALGTFPKGMQIGGGMNADNAAGFIEAGASHVIVTSYVFRDGKIDYDNLNKLVEAVGKEHIVLDLSCRRKEDSYYIVTDRWQKFTDVAVTHEVLDMLSQYCDEFLIHAVDVEGKSAGIDRNLVSLIGSWQGIPVTYAGGVRSIADLELLNEASQGRLDVTIGSALDLFGGNLKYTDAVEYCKNTQIVL
ncbi:MAG: phosphoribosylformimino-5-aminoimidazole carboxamide ribotide isomerase [Firmicutes bacterium]|nr:phosphoribosylformimino-5-aminoimidazole carboxamide ribotide isomerase [Bacillota bacterium]